MSDHTTHDPIDDALDRTMRAVALATRDDVAASVSAAEIERALADVHAGAVVTPLAAVQPKRARPAWALPAAAAAAVVLVVAGALVWLGRTPEEIRTTPSPAPTTPVPTPSLVSTVPPTAPSTVPGSVPSTVPGSVAAPALPTTAPTVPAPGPTTAPPSTDDPLAGLAWEDAGIPRPCVVHDEGFETCPDAVVAATGEPVTFDPATRTLTRWVREDGSYVEAVLPESFALAQLVAVGPDDVAYLNVPIEPGVEGSADLVAIALAPGDAGREVAREVGAGNPGYDADFAITDDGIAQVGWYGQGPRPGPGDALAMAWVDRDAVDDPWLRRGVTVDAYAHVVTVDGLRTWQLSGVAAEFAVSGMPRIVATFDGGFIGRFDELAGDFRTVVVRGWADGSVEEWVVPGGFDGPGWSVVPEPMGSVLVARDDRFVRAWPFAARPSGWSGGFDIDPASGAVTAEALNAYLAGLDPGALEVPWGVGPVAFVDAAVGPLASPAELRTIRWISSTDQDDTLVVTTERHLDDSVYATRVTITVRRSLDRVETLAWAQACQPERGQQDYVAAYCV